MLATTARLKIVETLAIALESPVDGSEMFEALCLHRRNGRFVRTVPRSNPTYLILGRICVAV